MNGNESGETPGITYAQPDNSPLPDTITLAEDDANVEYEYTISLNTQPSDDVMIQISLPANSPDNLQLSSGGDTADMANESITLTFTNTDWDTPQTVTLTLADDNLALGNVDVTIDHASGSSDSDYNSIPVYNLIVTTEDNEMPTATIPATLTIGEGDSTEISVSISHEPAQNVEITLTKNSDEASISPDILTFTPGNWNVPKMANVTIINNTVYSGDRDLLVSYSAVVSNTNNPYHGILISDTTITIIEDETTCIQPGAGAETDFTPNITGENYGAGTELNPYIICNANQLQAMRDDLDAFYELGQNIDASSITAEYTCPTGTTGTCTGFQPIGNCGADGMCGDNPSTPEDESLDDIGFTGTLDGKGFTISDLTININLTSGESYAGLFGYTLSAANIINIGLLNVDISSSSASGNSYAGGLVGLNDSGITNSYSTGNISFFSSIDFSFAGGLVGVNDSGITNSYSTGHVSSSSSVGGLVGLNSSSSITNSYYDQDTSSPDNAIGNNAVTITCVGGLSTPELISPTEPFTPPTTEPCEDDPETTMVEEPLKPFFNWQTLFDIDNADMDNDPTTGTDQFSVRYDSDNDGSVIYTDAFLWNFGSNTEYPFIASIPQTADEQAVTMASGFLSFSSTTLGVPLLLQTSYFSMI